MIFFICIYISLLHQHLLPYAIYAAWTSARTAGGRSALSLINPSATCISMPGHWGWATATRARFVVVFVFDLHFLTTTCLHNDKNRATRDNFTLLFSPSPRYKNTQKGNLLINTLGLVWWFQAHCVTQSKLQTLDKLSSSIFCYVSVCEGLVTWPNLHFMSIYTLTLQA